MIERMVSQIRTGVSSAPRTLPAAGHSFIIPSRGAFYSG
jgi:hypothetical protein